MSKWLDELAESIKRRLETPRTFTTKELTEGHFHCPLLEKDVEVNGYVSRAAYMTLEDLKDRFESYRDYCGGNPDYIIWDEVHKLEPGHYRARIESVDLEKGVIKGKYVITSGRRHGKNATLIGEMYHKMIEEQWRNLDRLVESLFLESPSKALERSGLEMVAGFSLGLSEGTYRPGETYTFSNTPWSPSIWDVPNWVRDKPTTMRTWDKKVPMKFDEQEIDSQLMYYGYRSPIGMFTLRDIVGDDMNNQQEQRYKTEIDRLLYQVDNLTRNVSNLNLKANGVGVGWGMTPEGKEVTRLREEACRLQRDLSKANTCNHANTVENLKRRVEELESRLRTSAAENQYLGDSIRVLTKKNEDLEAELEPFKHPVPITPATVTVMLGGFEFPAMQVVGYVTEGPDEEEEEEEEPKFSPGDTVRITWLGCPYEAQKHGITVGAMYTFKDGYDGDRGFCAFFEGKSDSYWTCRLEKVEDAPVRIKAGDVVWVEARVSGPNTVKPGQARLVKEVKYRSCYDLSLYDLVFDGEKEVSSVDVTKVKSGDVCIITDHYFDQFTGQSRIIKSLEKVLYSMNTDAAQKGYLLLNGNWWVKVSRV